MASPANRIESFIRRPRTDVVLSPSVRGSKALESKPAGVSAGNAAAGRAAVRDTKRKRCTDEQVAPALRQAESGTAVGEICCRFPLMPGSGASAASFPLNGGLAALEVAGSGSQSCCGRPAQTAGFRSAHSRRSARAVRSHAPWRDLARGSYPASSGKGRESAETRMRKPSMRLTLESAFQRRLTMRRSPVRGARRLRSRPCAGAPGRHGASRGGAPRRRRGRRRGRRAAIGGRGR